MFIEKVIDVVAVGYLTSAPLFYQIRIIVQAFALNKVTKVSVLSKKSYELERNFLAVLC
ncbi:MAG: hypothetical protein E7B43_02695 [Streptococcus sp.]|nr:hypothetical protein [Streptococcus sp.]MBS6655912.1 hypothetical protein [Streptococcus sp.]MBS7108598.1 hypothetical protein [Streptococcus sp.]MDU3069466.1 hypothetical protein [Streptococcus sp.]